MTLKLLFITLFFAAPIAEGSDALFFGVMLWRVSVGVIWNKGKLP